MIKSGLQLLPSALLCRDSPSPRSPDPLSHSVVPALAPASWPPWHDDLHNLCMDDSPIRARSIAPSRSSLLALFHPRRPLYLLYLLSVMRAQQIERAQPAATPEGVAPGFTT